MKSSSSQRQKVDEAAAQRWKELKRNQAFEQRAIMDMLVQSIKQHDW